MSSFEIAFTTIVSEDIEDEEVFGAQLEGRFATDGRGRQYLIDTTGTRFLERTGRGLIIYDERLTVADPEQCYLMH